ncbi:MAG TPA: MFS transporter [Trebonia sp.]|jgi:MFS family permease|nr:MFS transporter [Trebonia sp.]
MTDLTESITPDLAGRTGRAERAGRTGRPARVAAPGVALAIVLAGQMMAVIDVNIVNVAVPAMHATLGASGAGLQLIVAGYTIAYAVLLITGARLGDILGHRRAYLGGVALFTLASLGCGLAPSAGALIALRFVQGVGAAVMIPQVLSLIQRSYTAPGPRARAMSLYATVISGGAVLGQVLGGLLVSADLFGSSWRPVFLVNVPVGLAVLAFGRLLPAGRYDGVRMLDLPGLAVLTPAVLAFVLPLVLGQPLGWPVWGWVLLAASVALFALLGRVEGRVAARGGQPILPRSLLSLPGMAAGLGGLFATMAIFGGWLFSLALMLQDGLGESALRAGLTFVPCGVAFAAVSLNWRRLPGRYHGGLVTGGFLVNAAGLLWSGLLLHSGGDGGVWLYVALAVAGGGMAGSFGALMGRVISGVPVSVAADASGVLVTMVQLGTVVGIAAFGALYLNRAGQLPSHPGDAFALSSGHAYLVVTVALAALALVGAGLALTHSRAASRQAPAQV